jgi:cysteine desulfurase
MIPHTAGVRAGLAANRSAFYAAAMAGPPDARPIYLDHNATTPVHGDVRAAMLPWLGERWGNPSSPHEYGREAATAVERARAEVAELIGAHADEILFVSSGTEANNLALLGAGPPRGRIVTSAIEHPAVDAPAGLLAARGWDRVLVPVGRSGTIERDALRQALARPADITSVMLAHNETGAIQPVAEVAALVRAAHGRAIVHTDAAQAVGKIDVDVDDLGVDLLTIAGHKLYAPAGIGALFVRRGTELRPLLSGGGQEKGLRPGTEPVALVVGLGAACALARRDLHHEADRLASLRERLWAMLRAGISDVRRTGDPAACLPGTLHVRFVGQSGRAILARAPEIAASTGSACHRDGAAPSLSAMGLDHDDARGAVRLSLGRATTSGDVERAAQALVRACHGDD